MPDINGAGAASKPQQISDMFQKFALAFKAKTFESFADDEKAAGGNSCDGFALLDYTEEVITGQRVVVIKRDHCRAALVAAQSRLPEPNYSTAETLGREQRACGLSPESTRLAKDPWREESCVSGKMNSGERERGRDASSLGRNDTTWHHLSIAEWSAPMVTWKILFLFFLRSHFDFLSDSMEKCFPKKEMLGRSFFLFVAPFVLSRIAYERLHRKKASKCEVFLSFSGEDALKNFAYSLFKGMVDAGICVSRNDYYLRRHEKIRFQAIKSSKISIPILSPKYASKRRCLDELVQIIECKNDSSGHVVLPIFYRLKPADVRCEIDGCGPKVVEERERALTEISSLKGWKSDKIADGDEGQLVKLVVRKVLIELKKALEPVITENLVGIKRPMEEIMKCVDSRGSTLYVGIYGEDGIGKTTLAKLIYDKLSEQFDHCSFIPNVTESCKCNGVEYLQDQLIWDIGKKKGYDKNQLTATISSNFKRKKVLILLDDVNANDQLKALAGERNWFAPGSRIIVTTREKSVLDWAKVDYKHKHKAMEEDEAMILFARHAFRRDFPPEEFSILSHDVVSKVRKFPLTLEIIGSYLCGKNRASWEKTIKELLELQQLQDLRKSLELPQMEVQEILKIVYRELKVEQKIIFLDIACFLVGSDARIASCVWDTSDYNRVLGIEELIFMSLIKIGDNNELRVHDEVRDFGRSIVREGHCNEPGNGSRLWDYEEALKMLEGNEGTENIPALSLDKGNSKQPVDLDSSYKITDPRSRIYANEKFKNLVSLRFLSVSDANSVGDFNKIFSKLRWLRWEGCPEILEAKNFAVEELAVLDLSGSMISDNWFGWKSIMSAEKLKVLNLTGCVSLESTFFLSEFKHLEILILRNCNKLKKIYPSIGMLETLVSLDLTGCLSLEELPAEVGHLKGLKELFLDQTDIQEIPDSIWSLVKLQHLSLQSCSQLRLNRDSIVKLELESLTELVPIETKITELPKSIGNLQNLGILNIRGTGIETLPDYIGRLRNLRELDASGCKKLSGVTPSIRDLSSLQRLDLRNCLELQSLPKLPSNLIVVSVTCQSAELPSFAHLIHLKQLRLHNCNRLEYIPELPSTTLELEISGCESLKLLSPRKAVRDFKVLLKRLDIIRCESLGRLDLSQLNLLRVLYALDCVNIREIGGLDKLDSLESLTIQVDPSIELDKPFPSFRQRAYYYTH